MQIDKDKLIFYDYDDNVVGSFMRNELQDRYIDILIYMDRKEINFADLPIHLMFIKTPVSDAKYLFINDKIDIPTIQNKFKENFGYENLTIELKDVIIINEKNLDVISEYLI